MRALTNNGLGTEPTVTEARAGAREAESRRPRTLLVGSARVGRGWERWPLSLRQIGYSFKRGERRGDVSRQLNPETGLTEWHAKVWHAETGAGAATFTGQDLHEAFEFVEGGDS